MREVLIILALFSFAGAAPPQHAPKGGDAVAFTLTSSSFQNNQPIPRKFTCDGEDASPALAWSDPPSGTKAFALIVDDPDAPGGDFVHWVAYDLPAGVHALPEGVPKADALPAGGRQGRTGFGRVGYGGPCPPPGKPHHYRFKLYALSGTLGLPAGQTKAAVLRAIGAHPLATAELTGTYARAR
ncbi:MAG TPA: YbhB/YbcL family Raf kinase inhibitor-like protein [Terriglobales bacterium]|nr:YbhB/YbcL family Raf kinase inhibitor-like protein [Terriglobales bacterium]